MKTITTVYDSQRQSLRLASEIAPPGGEGTVYLSERSEVVVKIYHPEILQKRGHIFATKIKAMVEMKEMFRGKICWPSVLVFDASGNWHGYAMRRVDGIPMHKMAHPMLNQKHFPGLDRKSVIDYLLSFLDKVLLLHRHSIMIGDYNLQNILLKPGTNQVDLIDCDSYQVRTARGFFHCPVGSPDMTAPEQQNKRFEDIERTIESELFSIAIVLFKCLVLSRHPYDSVGGDDTVSNICRGHFPYGVGSHGVPIGPWYNIWSHMPHRLKSQFIMAFSEGAKDPSKRPTLAEWRETLQIYRKEIDKGWHESAMRPEKPKSKEHKGQKSTT